MKANSSRNQSLRTEPADGTAESVASLDHTVQSSSEVSSLEESPELDDLDAPDADDDGDEAWWEDAFIPDDDECDPLPEYHDFWDEVNDDD